MSIFDHSDEVSVAPSWRCPHCRTLQAETTRCWRCSRSAVTCSSCHRFRPAVAGDLGYCVGDSSRSPLDGDEIRACWEAVPSSPAAPGLFDELEPPSEPPAVRPPPPPLRPRRRARARTPKPPLEEIRAAAWADAPSGDLVDAPHVEPVGEVMSEVGRRRRRFWRR